MDSVVDSESMDPLNVVFHNLDTWRHYPNYQLERRADIFFSVYLKGVVEEFMDVALEDDIVPEFPLKRDLIWPDHPTNKSVKVDYALFARNRSRVFFVELKTDGESRRDEQDTYLATSKRLGFKKIVEGVRSIMMSTSAHQKYHHLAVVLARLGFLTLPPDLASYIYPIPREGLLPRLAQIAPTDANPPVEVIYIQPNATAGDRCIDFERFATHVAKFSDPLSRMFCEHLRRWRAAAGSREPGV